ncbi:MAG: hypothetical protein Aurels2KO_03850 [Aureliella sp.]
MMSTLTARLARISAACLLVFGYSASSQAAIVTFRDGQDLVVEFERSFEFTMTERYEDAVYGIVLQNVYSQNNVAPASSDQVVGNARMSFGVPPEIRASESFGTWGQFDAQFGALNERGLYGEFVFADAALGKVGSRATLAAGNVRMLGYFDNPNAVAPDRQASGMVLTDRMGRAVSGITAVPEPSSLGCVAACLLSLLRRRRPVA